MFRLVSGEKDMRPPSTTRPRALRQPTLASPMAPMLTPLLIALLACQLRFAGGSFTFVLPFGEEICFFIRTPAGAKALISGNFDILDDELIPDPISVALHDSEMNEVWRSEEGESEGIFSIEGNGKYELCFMNQFGMDDFYGGGPGEEGERTIGFSTRVIPVQHGMGEDEEGPDTLKTAELIASSVQLVQMLENMEDHQAYLRSREAVHRDIVERTFQRIVRWTVLEALVLITVAAGQVMYLKKFFEKRSYL